MRKDSKTNDLKRLGKKKKFYQNISLLFISITIFCLLLEVTLRLFGYGNLILYQPDPNLFWKPKPNQNCFTKIGHKPIYVNSKGTRGKDFVVDKPQNVFRIISVGDSKTFGWGLSESETYSGLIEHLLQSHFKDSLRVEVINAGVNAWSYPQIYVYLRDIAIKYEPDMVILADANLWTQFSQNGSSEFVSEMMKKVWLKNLLRRSAIYHFFIEVKLKRFYYKYRKNFIPLDPENDKFFQEQQNESPYFFFEEIIANICKLLSEHNVKPLVIYIPHEKRLMSSEKSMILPIKRKICKEFDIPLIDFTEYFRQIEKKLYLEGDPVHPNADGNRIIAGKIYDYILRNRISEDPFLQIKYQSQP